MASSDELFYIDFIKQSSAERILKPLENIKVTKSTKSIGVKISNTTASNRRDQLERIFEVLAEEFTVEELISAAVFSDIKRGKKS